MTGPRSRKCGGATARNVRDIVGKPVAGKSGTTDGDKTAALVAMTKQFAVAGIMADPDWAQTNQKMGHDETPTGINPAVYQTLRDAMKGKPEHRVHPAQRQDRSMATSVRIPNVKCQSVDSARSRLKDAGFSVVVSDNRSPRTARPAPSPAPARTAAPSRAAWSPSR